MRSRRYLQFLTRGNAEGAPYVDLQLRPIELAAIGHVAAQWAFLEFFILRETRGLVHHLGIITPEDMNAISFRKRRQLWEELTRKALVGFDEELFRALDCIDRTKKLAVERHRLTHDIVEYDPEDENRLKAFPRASLGKFGWPLNTARIEKTARDIARLNHDILSIHSDLVSVPGASRRTQDKPNPSDLQLASGSRDRHQASRRSRKPRQ
jgi:hypothetical protein